MNYKINIPEPVPATITIELTVSEAEILLRSYSKVNIITQRFHSMLEAGVEEINEHTKD